MSIHVFGIRHHGPGCARSLRAALAELQPDIVLVEGPPDAHEVLPLLMHNAMRPPVALLIYDPATPHHAAFYPFAAFSPEWQALRYALERAIPARFMDLPQSVQLAQNSAPPAGGETPRQENNNENQNENNGSSAEGGLRDDPIGALAEAAGYDDHELWWEHQIEQRQDAAGLFDGILEAMSGVRAGSSPPQRQEAQREAHMRQVIRTARREGFMRIAVVCGAWHAPVLTAPGPAKEDAALLAGLRRIKVTATWIPWTYGRLSYRSGYGAGVYSPGWYEHLWTAPDRHAMRWIARIAQLLRGEDLDASPASVIEAVRLSETLAALRELPMPGLTELSEAAQAVLCMGDPAPMRLIRNRLEIGERLGEVPAETPSVPLQQDLAAWQRRLRLQPSAEERTLDLDLRNETDRTRSHLLYRLHLLGIPWGQPQRVSGKSGTFHEIWRLQWQAELAVALIEANVWGNTVESAAAARARADGEGAELPRLTALLDAAILAALPDAVNHLLILVRQQAAVAADVRRLMEALPPLARVMRYGDVRGTAGAHVAPVVDALFERIVVGLPGACASLDDSAAAEIVAGMGHVQESLNLLDQAEQKAAWRAVLRRLADRDGVHGLVRGWCCRLLLDAGALDAAELHRLARLALSPVTPSAQAAAWLEGVLRGSGQLLLHQDGLWAALDTWLAELSPEGFTEVLPLVRRAFSGFQPPERRTMGAKVKHLHRNAGGSTAASAAGNVATGEHSPIDVTRANLVLPVLARLLSVPFTPPRQPGPLSLPGKREGSGG